MQSESIPQVLPQIKALVIDLDGTTYIGDTVFSFTFDFLLGLQSYGIKYLFLTNNSSRSGEEHRQKLERLGISITREQIYTSQDATIKYLHHLNTGKNLYLLATPGVAAEFEEAGYETDASDPDFVVLAFDLTLTYEKLDRACYFVRRGLPFIATHEDTTWIVSEDHMRPDCGALAAAITAATGIKPKFIGKPNPEMVQGFLKRLKLTPDQVAVVGDKLNTDVRMGQTHGITTFLVLTGKTRREDLNTSPIQPDFVLQRNVDVLKYLASQRCACV